MGVRVQVCLWNAISRALKDYGDTIDIEGLMFEKLPGDLSCSLSARGYARRMCRYQEYCENAGGGRYSRPYSQRGAKAISVKKDPNQERTNRSHDVLARQNNSICHSSIAGIEPFAKRQCGRTVDKSTP